jgi:hypothetical protein
MTEVLHFAADGTYISHWVLRSSNHQERNGLLARYKRFSRGGGGGGLKKKVLKKKLFLFKASEISEK